MKSIIAVIFASFAILTLSSCTISGKKAYKKYLKTESSNIITNINQAIPDAEIHKLSLNTEFKSRITKQDIIIKKENYNSFLKVHSFRPPKTMNYKLTVNGYCDCYGFTKTLIIPEITILNSDGEPVFEKFDSLQFMKAVGMRSVHMQGILQGSFEDDSDYFIVLTTNNNRAGEISEVIEARYGGTTGVTIFSGTINLAIQNSPVGKYIILIEEI